MNGKRYRYRFLETEKNLYLLRDDGYRIAAMLLEPEQSSIKEEWIPWADYKQCDIPRIGEDVADALMTGAAGNAAVGFAPDIAMVPNPPDAAMLDAGGEALYGHPRARAVEWGKEDKFNSRVFEAGEVFAAMIAAARGNGDVK